MKQFFKVIFSSTILLTLVVLIFINSKLYYSPVIKVIRKDTVNYEVLTQLRTLKKSLDQGEDLTMQNVFPEGFVFFNALYGLSWCELAGKIDKRSDLFREAEIEVENSLRKICSKQGYYTFDLGLPLSYGAFYRGWSSYLLAKKLQLSLPGEMKQTEVDQFKGNCTQIAEALLEENLP